MESVRIFVDGSWNGRNASWAFIVFDKNEDTPLFQNKGVLEGQINKMRNVAGEIKSVVEAVRYCKKENLKAEIYYDYKGIFNWVADIFNEKQKPWAANNKYTKAYRKIILDHAEHIESFHKVKSHSNNYCNDLVDAYVKI